MKEFKTWHEEDNITFHTDTHVYFSQCNSNGTLSISELLRITSDIAVEDYNQQGLSREKLLEGGFAILVSRVSLRLHRLPHENEDIRVTTYEEKPEALQLKRAYEIESSTGEKLVTGLSTWLLVDPKARRIIPSKNFTMHTPTTIQNSHDCLPPGKIKTENAKTLIGERKILFSDIDANGHTNNSRYGAFALDALPNEYRNKRFTDIKINYSKEAMLDETLRLYADFAEQEKRITVVGKTDANTSFECELYYE